MPKKEEELQWEANEKILEAAKAIERYKEYVMNPANKVDRWHTHSAARMHRYMCKLLY